MKSFILICCILISFKSMAQTLDFDLIKEKLDSVKSFERKVEFGLSKSKNKFIQYNPITLVMSTMMYSYQKYISQQTLSNCPYSLSCSQFGKKLFANYTIFKAIPCTADRLMRCRSDIVDELKWKRNAKTGLIVEDVSYYQLIEQNKFDSIQTLLKSPYKSAFLAASLSTVVPGLGKWYVGSKKEAISSFITVLPLALLFVENIYKFGVKHPQTITVGAIFSMFYIGNIFGSYYCHQSHIINEYEKHQFEINAANPSLHIH